MMRGPATTTKRLSDEELKSVVEHEFPMLASPEGLKALQSGAKPMPRKDVMPPRKEKSAFTLYNDVEVDFSPTVTPNKKTPAPSEVPA